MKAWIHHREALLLVAVLASPLLAQEEEPRWLEGRFLGPARAVAQARIELRAVPRAFEQWQVRLGIEDPVVEVTQRPDRTGSFRLKAPGPGPWKLVAVAPGYLTMEFPVPPLGRLVEVPSLELWPAELEQLQILDPEGRPAPAWVETRASRDRRPGEQSMLGWRRSPWSAWTNQDGKVDLVRGEGEELRLVATNDWGRERITLGPGEGEGSVRHEPWQVWREVWVEIKWGGAVEDEVTNGQAQALLVASGLPLALAQQEPVRFGVPQTGRLEAFGSSGNRGSWSTAELLTRPSSREAPILLGLSPSGLLEGTVRSAGKPLRGAVVVVLGELARTDDKGLYRLPFYQDSAGAIEVYAPAHLPRRIDSATVRAIGPASYRLDVELSLAAGLEGIVVDQEGRPLAAAEVIAERIGPKHLVFARSRRDGTFALPSLVPQSTYRLRAAWQETLQEKLDERTLAAASVRSDVRIVLRPRRSLSGRVLVSQRRGVEPLANALVSIGRRQEHPGSDRPYFHRDLETRSGRDGRFSWRHLEMGCDVLQISAPGFLAATVDLDLPEEGGVIDVGDIILDRGSFVELYATDRWGQPVEGARVEINPEELTRRRLWGEEDSLRNEPAQYVTDEDGKAELLDLADGQWTTLRVSHADFVTLELTPRRRAYAERPFRVELRRSASLEGEVLDSDGTPVAAAHVSLVDVDGVQDLPSGLFAKTDLEGRFFLSGIPPGRFKVWARVFDRAEIEAQHLTLAEGETVEGLVFRVPSSALLEGKVRSADGQELEGVRLVLPGLFARTAADGSFRFEAAPLGQHQLEITTLDGGRVEREVEIPAGGTYIDIQLDPAPFVSGRVLPALDEGVAGLEVRLLRPGRSSGRYQIVGDDGLFRFEQLISGSYRLAVTRDGIEVARSPQLRVDERPIEGLELRLGAGRISGQLRGLEVIPERLLVVASNEATRRQQPLAADGTFRFADLQSGRWELRATVDNLTARATVDLGVADEAWVELELPDRSARVGLSGRVFIDGEPAVGAIVFLSAFDRGAETHGTVESSGTFSTQESVPPGLYELAVSLSGASFSQAIELPAVSQVSLDLSRIVVEGRVVEAESGSPVSGARVVSRSTGLSPGGTPLKRLSTAADGTFAFAALTDGRGFRLEVEAPGYQETMIDLSAGSTNGIEIRLAAQQASGRASR